MARESITQLIGTPFAQRQTKEARRFAVRTSSVVLGVAVLALAIEAHAQAVITPAAEASAPARPATAPTDANAPAPTTHAPGSPLFRTSIDLVALSVVVTDQQQRHVTGLSADDFAVFEDGIEQEVSFFATQQVPLDLALLLDTSASMHDKMETMQQAAVGFLQTLRSGDRTTIVDIKDSVRVAYPLGDDFVEAHTAVRRTFARGGTALFNGLYLALKEMVKQRKANGDVRRQAIAVLSDGEDTASLVAYDDVMELAKQSGITIYTITLKSAFAIRQASLSGRRYFSEAEFSMKALAQETGARSFFPTEIEELAGVYGVIATELANQYAIGYSPKNPNRDGAFRRVVVRVADRPDVRTRTRSGYLAARTR
jgi:Ca-activated chloride channel family protein